MDLGVFQETKLTKCIYTRESSGFKVVVTETPIAHSGSVAIFYRTTNHLSVEAFQVHGANIVRRQAVVYRGVLRGPRQCLNHRGRCRGHRQAAPWGRAAGGRRFQHQPGFTIGAGEGQDDRSGTGRRRLGRHERPIPPTAQSLVEVWPHMGNALGLTGRVLLYRLHPGHRHSSVLERSSSVCVTQHRPLLGLGVNSRSQA